MNGSKGELFTRNYMKHGQPASDSKSMRVRISTLFFEYYADGFNAFLKLKRGLISPSYSEYGSSWDDWFLKLELVEFLDVITVFNRYLERRPAAQKAWLDGIKEVFSEENVGYRIDQLGGVHFSVDKEFERNQASTIGILKNGRYHAAGAHFEAGQKALDSTPPQTREAIRQTFECVETLFKLMFPDENLLGGNAVTKRLKPLVERRAKSDPERAAVGRMAESMKEWVNGAHNYRHAAGSEVPDNPSVGFAVLSISTGASFARWLAEIDADLQSAKR